MKTCSEENCEKPSRTKGLCSAHYMRQLRGKPEPVSDADRGDMPDCAVSHCTIQAASRTDGALCDPHYQLKYRGIDPETRIVRKSDPRRHELTCWVDGCSRRVSKKSLCGTHYNSARRGKLTVPEDLGVTLNPICSVEGCEDYAEHVKSGLCRTHREHVAKYGEARVKGVYGLYTEGEVECLVADCNKHAVSAGLCATHTSRRSKFNVSVERFVELVAIAECENPGCSNTVNLHIDHDHSTDVVRGMLCNGCNSALGMLHEDIDRMAGLIEYKKLHG